MDYSVNYYGTNLNKYHNQDANTYNNSSTNTNYNQTFNIGILKYQLFTIFYKI